MGCEPEQPGLIQMPFGWEALGAEAWFTGRAGGVSLAPYASLNLSFGRKDELERVLENHRRVGEALGCPLESMVRVRQVHGARVAVVEATDGGIHPHALPRLDGVDALVTRDPSVVLLTTHADCVPVYFFDPEQQVIGLAHAGWGGILSGVVEATLDTMRQVCGCHLRQLRVGLGPHIRACCFEVKTDVLSRFESMSWWQPALLEAKEERFHVNLAGCVRAILAHDGIMPDAFSDQGACTCCDPQRYFSHRGSGGHTGTGAALLRLKPLLLALLILLLSGCAAFPGLNALNDVRDTQDAVLTDGQTPAVEGTPIGGIASPDVSPPTQAGLLSGMGEVLQEDTGPAMGGTLRLFMLKPQELDPYVSLNPDVVDCGWFLSDSLVTRNDRNQIRPLLARELRASQEGRIWDLVLQEGVHFADGSALTPEDVVFSLQRAAASGGVFSKGLKNLDKMEVTGRLGLRLILKVPDPLFTRHLVVPIFARNSWVAGQESGKPRFEPNGLGAYRLGLREASGIMLERHENWWQAAGSGPLGHPAWPDKIRYVIGESDADRLTFFQQRLIDVTWTVDADTSRYQSRNDIEVRTFAGNRMEFLVFGAKSAALQRQDIRTLLNRYLASARQEASLTGDAVVEERYPPLSREDVIPMLVEAGCRYQQKGESPPVLSIPTTYGVRTAAFTLHYNALSVERLKSAQWIADALAPLGITCYLQEVTADAAKKMLSTGQFDLLLLGGEFPVGLSEGEMITEMRQLLPATVAEIFTLYRERRAMLYQTRIRGEKSPLPTLVYGGWTEWYLLEPAAAEGDA